MDAEPLRAVRNLAVDYEHLVGEAVSKVWLQFETITPVTENGTIVIDVPLGMRVLGNVSSRRALALAVPTQLLPVGIQEL